MAAMITVKTSVSEEVASWTVTAAISPREEALTPSSRLLAQFEFRIFGMSGFDIATCEPTVHHRDE
ncbi:MAG TPA: hypothetical protein VMN99_04290 [Anaerolineales bacterium]|nr:hypothetical protein [Anaerolineales bacterium]